MNENTMLALNQNWLGDSAQDMTFINSNNSLNQLTGGCYQTSQCYPTVWYYPSYSYPVYISSPARPIKLTLSEVERLRKAAKGDDKIKAILSKFTELIEITVDFE